MTSIHPTRSNTSKQSMRLQSPVENNTMQITYSIAMDMLDNAQLDVGERYSHIPQLCKELQTQFRDGIAQCNLRKRDPVDLLKTRLCLERLVFDAYNKHRLGNFTWRYYEANPVPYDAKNRLIELGDDIEEDLESFPLRLEVVTHGFDSLTKDLLPIYQIADHSTDSAMETDPNPVTPQTTKKSTAKTPANGTLLSTKLTTNRAIDNYDKLADAPPCNLDFPVGNITIAELAAYHPEGLKSWDMIDRICGNGGSTATIANMFNNFREMNRGKIKNNSVYRMMKGSIDKRAREEPEWAGWTTGIHDQYPQPRSFDPASISVTGFRTPGYGKNKASAPPIPIKDMANGVKNFPTGYDALDLTRAVRHCVAHPDETWMYPDDYERLVNQLGPALIQTEHQDAAIFARYTSAQMAAGVRNANGRKRDSHGRLVKKGSNKEDFDAIETGFREDLNSDIDFEALDKKVIKRKRNTFDDSDDDEFDTPFGKPNKRKNPAPKPRSAQKPMGQAGAPPSRLRKELFAADFDSESDGDAYAGPKKAKKKIAEIRRSNRTTKVTKPYNLDFLDKIDEDEGDRGAPANKKPGVMSKYGMSSEMSDSDEF